MTVNEVQTILNTKKRGQFLTITYHKVLGNYVKTTTTTVRLVDYNNVKQVKEKKALQGLKPTITTQSSKVLHLGNNLIYNVNTGKTSLQCFVTNHHKPHCIYEYCGQEITKDQWYAESGDRQSTPDLMFNVRVENILAIK